jgi:hypothetical protein
VCIGLNYCCSNCCVICFVVVRLLRSVSVCWDYQDCWKKKIEYRRIEPKLKYLVCYSKSDVLFLNEIVIHSNKTDEFRYLLDFDNCLVVSNNGQSGGLLLFWCHSFNCMVLNYSANHINVEGK